MNETLVQKHGLQKQPEERKHLHIYVSRSVIEEVDRMVPARMRSRFVESCLKNELETFKAN